MILSLLSTLYILLSFLGIGKFLGSYISIKKLKNYQSIALGFCVFQLSYLALSLLFVAKMAFYLQFFISLIGFIAGLKQLRRSSFKRIQILPIILGVVLLLPLLARLISPPISPDGLSFYLPNMEWVFRHGIKFNPYLTAYTTMPLGAERIFAFAYGINGTQSIRFLDASFALLLLFVVFKETKTRTTIYFAVIACLIVLIIPGTFIWNFGTGKVDTINTFLFLAGFFSIVNEDNKKNWLPGIIILSSSLNVKYTSWILVSLPIVITSIFYIINSKKIYRFLVFLVPALFILISVLKNLAFVYNPLAPLIETENQNRFIQNHGELPEENDTLNYTKTFIDSIIEQVFSFGLFNTLHVIVLLILFLMIISKKQTFKEYKFWFVLLLSSALIWLFLLGSTPQPLRFYWGNLIIIILLVIIVLYHSFKSTTPNTVPKVALVCMIILSLSVMYKRKGHYIADFIKYRQEENLGDWYESVHRYHYAISFDIASSNIDKSKIYFKEPIALGLLELEEYNGIPNDEEVYELKKTKPDSRYQYVLCRTRKMKSYPEFNSIKFKRGVYVLLEKTQ